METVKIEINKELFDELVKQGVVSVESLKEVNIHDDFFKDDKTHIDLKKASVLAYKELKIYEFKKRYNINNYGK
jgi:hypothetical protein